MGVMRRTAEKERSALGFISWSEAVAARDRATWRRRVLAVYPLRVMAKEEEE